MDKNQKIRWGILGCGKIAHKFAADLALSNHGLLVACASRDGQKSINFAARFGAKIAFDNYDDMAKYPDVDIIYIATPHSFHYEQSILCLEHKKAVLCEKPMGVNSAQVNKMIATAKANNTFLMEAMWTAFLPNIIEIQQKIDTQIIGDITHINADFGFKSAFDPNGRLFNSILAGGSLLDIGIYPIFLSLLLLGKPTKIYSNIRRSITNVDISCTMMFTYENGQSASLFSSFESDTDTKCEIYGTNGKIRIPTRFHEQDNYFLTDDSKNTSNIKLSSRGLGYIHEIEHVHKCLTNNLIESPVMTFEKSIDLINIMDQIRAQNHIIYPSDT